VARDLRDLQRLVDELAALTPEERTRVLTDVQRRSIFHPLPQGFKPPVLKDSGGKWIGGDLRREDIYGDDGR
jgi:hypothetical protein